jgi:hypothetical protein
MDAFASVEQREGGIISDSAHAPRYRPIAIVRISCRVDPVARLARLDLMGIFSRQHGTLVPVHEENAYTRDWLVLLEAATVVGHERDKLRVALTTQDRTFVKKRRLFRKPEHFLVLDGYDPRIHALYFCPQLYKNQDGSLVPLSGPEIGQLMANALEGAAIEKPPWYEPADGVPKDPVIKAVPGMEFDSLVVDAPSPKANTSAALRAVPAPDKV